MPRALIRASTDTDGVCEPLKGIEAKLATVKVRAAAEALVSGMRAMIAAVASFS